MAPPAPPRQPTKVTVSWDNVPIKNGEFWYVTGLMTVTGETICQMPYTNHVEITLAATNPAQFFRAYNGLK